MQEKLRWQQRFSNYKKALSQLSEVISLGKERALSKWEEHGLIQAFEYTYELAWNTLKDYLNYQGNQNIYGSRQAIQEAFKMGLIQEGEIWMEMYKDRNNTSHTYQEILAKEIAQRIQEYYFSLFKDLTIKLESLEKNE